MIRKKNFPVMWIEGMPITPQVFQQNFIYNQNNLSNLFGITNPNFFGIVKLEWKKNQLNNDILHLKYLEAILPNFVHIILDEEDNISINLANHKNALKEKELYIFINIANNFYSKNNNVPFYAYELTQKNIADLNEKENEAIVNFSKPCLFLSAEESSNLTYISLPLTKIKFNSVNIDLTNDFGPTININNNEQIVNYINALLEKLKNKFYYLKIKKHSSFYKEMSTYLLSKSIYTLEHILASSMHPEQAFHALNGMLPDMLFFYKEKQLLIAQSYNHYQYQSLILNLLQYINNSVENIYESYVQIRFTKEEKVFVTPMQYASGSIIIGIEKNENLSLQETIEWLNQSIICNEEELEKNKIQRTIGFTRSVINSFKELNITEIQDIILVKITGNILPGKITIYNQNSLLQPNAILFFTEKE